MVEMFSTCSLGQWPPAWQSLGCGQCNWETELFYLLLVGLTFKWPCVAGVLCGGGHKARVCKEGFPCKEKREIREDLGVGVVLEDGLEQWSHGKHGSQIWVRVLPCLLYLGEPGSFSTSVSFGFSSGKRGQYQHPPHGVAVRSTWPCTHWEPPLATYLALFSQSLIDHALLRTVLLQLLPQLLHFLLHVLDLLKEFQPQRSELTL